MDILGIGECMIELDAEASFASSSVYRRQVGGDVYNTLVTCSRLGSRAGFYSRVAMDGFGQVLFRHFEENAVDTRLVQKSPDGVNGVYFTAIREDGRHEFVYYRQQSAASQMSSNQINARLIQGVNVVFASGITQAISPAARETVLKAFCLAKEHGKLVAYDPNYRPSLWKHNDAALDAIVEVLPYVDVILPSVEDLQKLFNFQDVAHSMEFFRLRGVPIVALKQGEQGVTLGFRNHQEHLPAVTVPDIKDSIGAGDAFNGGFLHGMIQERSLLECAQIGSMVAAKSLRQSGPINGLPDWLDVEEALKSGAVSASL
jgi:2-dehydro-3-deoxygluconokinase